MEYIGLHDPADRLVIERGSEEELQLRAYWSGPDGRLTAAMHINDWGAIEELERLIEDGATTPRPLA
jgi:hypothetical protein